MPGQGRASERDYASDDRAALLNAIGGMTFGIYLNGDTSWRNVPASELDYPADERAALVNVLGETTFDIYLNGDAFWRNVPAAVWNYRLGGYQVLKKWLSYRERSVLGRPLNLEEVQHFSDTARRIARVLTIR